MPINRPPGSFRNGRWVGWRLTTGRHYLILPATMAERLEEVHLTSYWRYMACQLRRIGLHVSQRNAWRLFAD
jgi:hypothetical protein